MTRDRVVDLQKKRHETALVDFLIAKSGCFVLLTNDQKFIEVLSTVSKKYSKDLSSRYNFIVSDPLVLDISLTSLQKNNKKIFLFAEFMSFGVEMTSLIAEVKKTFPDVYITILLQESDRGHSDQARRCGAHSIIVKPISEESVIEKIALVLLPEGKVAQLLKLARRFYDQKEYDKSMELVQQVLLTKPNSASAFMLLGDIFKQLGQVEDAKKEYQVAYSYANMFVDPIHKLIEISEDLGDTKSQLNYLIELDSIAPNNVNRKISIGALSLESGDMETADDSFSVALKCATEDAYTKISEISQHIASIYSEKYPEKEEVYLKKAMEVKRKYLSHADILLFNQLGLCLRKQAKWEEAITNYTQALTLAPAEPGLYYNTALAYSEGEHFIEACKFLHSTIKYNPHFPYQSPTIACNFGFIFTQGNELDEAKKWFEVTLEIDPDHYVAKKSLQSLSL